jgi:lipopolysaccharide biosynthesis glycosyltransferase
MEEIRDGVNQHGVGRSGVETAGFFEGQDPLRPVIALVTGRSQRALTAQQSARSAGCCQAYLRTMHDELGVIPASVNMNSVGVFQKQTIRNAVCFCTDRRMLIPSLFVADAVKSHSKGSDNCFVIIIFAEPSEVTDTHRIWMEQRGIILCEDMDLSRQRVVGKFSGRLSPATLIRLSLAEHLAGRYDKILYLDCDLTIHGDISPIFSLDTAPFALAAVPAGRILADLSERRRKEIENHFHQLGMTKPFRYFNSGVLYIDVKRWNSEKLGERTLEFIRQNPDLCVLPDEDALNAVLDGNIAELSPIWNARPQPRWHKKGTDGIANPVIIHHVGNEKPWRRFVYGRSLFPDMTGYKLYKEFLKDSPWPGWLDEQWNLHDLYMNIRGEIGRILRWLRLIGEWEEPSARQRKAYDDAVRQYYEKARFADMEQGIVIRENGKFRLKNKSL